MLDLVFRNDTTDKLFKEKFFRDILAIAIKELKFQQKVEVSVNLVGESEIKTLNKKYRHKDETTDVLSFPLNDKPATENGILALGDIFICLSFVKNEAKRDNIDIETKLAQLTVHGFLHLTGYDHEKSKDDADRMFNLEKKILKNSGF